MIEHSKQDIQWVMSPPIGYCRKIYFIEVIKNAGYHYYNVKVVKEERKIPDAEY